VEKSGRYTRLARRILLGSFWSFLFVLSGITAIAFTSLCYAGSIPTESFPLAAFLACLGIGTAYLAIGIFIAARHGKP
jgi:hypothetical protein